MMFQSCILISVLSLVSINEAFVVPSTSTTTSQYNMQLQMASVADEITTSVVSTKQLIRPKSTADIMAENTVADIYESSVQKTYG
jgi:hypothetical protein